MCRCRPNVLICGSESPSPTFISALTAHVTSPAAAWSAVDVLQAGSLVVAGTVILTDVETLDLDQQRRLIRWLDDVRERSVQVIVVSGVPLYPLVKSGVFLDRLYYRLNLLRFDLMAA